MKKIYPNLLCQTCAIEKYGKKLDATNIKWIIDFCRSCEKFTLIGMVCVKTSGKRK